MVWRLYHLVPEENFLWFAHGCMPLSSSFECVCQPVPIYAASLYHYLSQGDELLDENSKELNGETTEKAVWGPSALNVASTLGMFASVRQWVNMVMVEMWCCQSQLSRWVLVGGH